MKMLKLFSNLPYKHKEIHMNIVILTPCTRYENLVKIRESIYSQSIPDEIKIKWIVSFDARSLKEIPIETMEFLANNSVTVDFVNDPNNVVGKSQVNRAIEGMQEEEWIYVLDDDNVLHENFF